MLAHLYVMNILSRLTMTPTSLGPTLLQSLKLTALMMVTVGVNIQAISLNSISAIVLSISLRINISLRLVLYKSITLIHRTRRVGGKLLSLRYLQLHLLDLVHVLDLPLA